MRLLLYDHKYGKALTAMNIRHGKDFDCMRHDCATCQPYRDKEAEWYQSLTEEQRKDVHFGRIG